MGVIISANVGNLDFVFGRVKVDDAAVTAHLQTVCCSALKHGMAGQLAQHGLNRLERAKRLAAAYALVRLAFIEYTRLFALWR